jgi:hypothetical protein
MTGASVRHHGRPEFRVNIRSGFDPGAALSPSHIIHFSPPSQALRAFVDWLMRSSFVSAGRVDQNRMSWPNRASSQSEALDAYCFQLSQCRLARQESLEWGFAVCRCMRPDACQHKQGGRVKEVEPAGASGAVALLRNGVNLFRMSKMDAILRDASASSGLPRGRRVT